MRLIVNGQELTSEATTLASLVSEREMEGRWFATALNGTFVPADQREATALSEGDRVEILSPMQGG